MTTKKQNPLKQYTYIMKTFVTDHPNTSGKYEYIAGSVYGKWTSSTAIFLNQIRFFK